MLDPASESASTCSPNDSPCPGVEYVFTLVTPSEQEMYWQYKQIKKQTQEQDAPAGRTVWNGMDDPSQCQNQEDTT